VFLLNFTPLFWKEAKMLKISYICNSLKINNINKSIEYKNRKRQKEKQKNQKEKSSARRPPPPKNVIAKMSGACKFFLHAILTAHGAMGDPLSAIFFEDKTPKNRVFKMAILKTPAPR